MNEPILAQKIITEAENILAGKAREMTEEEFAETVQAIAQGISDNTLAWQDREDGEQDLVTVH